MDAIGKLIFSLCLGVLCYFILPFSKVALSFHLIASWDVFCFCLLILNWITFFNTDTATIRSQAKKQDDSRVIIFIIILVATAISMLSIIQMLINGPAKNLNNVMSLIIEVSCMTLSWCLVHTVFSIRYAHLYYSNHRDNPDAHAGGLEFPKEEKPDFIDFAYYSFTLGMTFQVSDVSITSRKLRRLTLLHSVFSFAFNAAIIAFTVNVISGLIQK